MGDFNAERPKRKRLKWWHYLIIVIGSLFVLFALILLIMDFNDGRSEVRYHNTTYAMTELAVYDSFTICSSVKQSHSASLPVLFQFSL